MQRGNRRLGAALAAWAGFGFALGFAPDAAHATEDTSLHDLIVVLKERGAIGEDDYEAIAAKNAAYEAKQRQDRKPKLTFWGDFRARYEGIFFNKDETGVERTNRHRGRYRFRLNGKAEINSRAQVIFRLVSGAPDNRSANQSFGTALDFDTDPFSIDRAYARLSPFPGGRLGENGHLAVEIGKVPNPYVWKKGRDVMHWDHDISLEGATIRAGTHVSENTELFFNGGYYVIDENSRDKDPHLWAGQIGVLSEPGESVEFGARATYYHFDSLDPEFHLRGVDGTGGITSAGGNIIDGLSGGVGGQNVQVVSATAYVAMLTDTSWPVLLFGTWSNNLTAEKSSLTIAEQEDIAWGGGVEIGNKKKYVKLGVGYWHIEANAFPSQFIDSNITDGRTNREGWVVYASRAILKNTDLNLTAFFSDEINDNVPPFGDSVPNADRVRVQADLVFKFK